MKGKEVTSFAKSMKGENTKGNEGKRGVENAKGNPTARRTRGSQCGYKNVKGKTSNP